MNQREKKRELCPICKTELKVSDNVYTLNELFKLWAPVQFSKKTTEEHRLQSEYTQMYSCPECKIEIFLPQIIGTSNFFEDLLKHESYYFYSDEKLDFDEALKDTKNCDAIIEIGCGPGNFIEKVKPYVAQVYGTEYNERALRIARDKGLKVFEIDDKNVAKMKGQFDAAFSFHVLEHVAEPVKFIQELISWIKPGGKIGISVPNQDGPIKYIKPCIQNMPPHHATRWHLKTFETIAEKFSLKIEKIVYEPLISRDYYYSTYWANHKFSGKSFLMKLFRFTVNKLFYLFFKMLSIFGKNSIVSLKGQSIYVLLSKAK